MEARDVLASLLTAYANLPESGAGVDFADSIRPLAERVENVFFSEGIGEEEYRAFFSELEAGEERYAGLLALALNGKIGPEQMPTVREAFGLVFTHFSSAALDGILRGLIDTRYDADIAKNEARAETYRNMPAVSARYFVLADQLRREKAIFDGIGRDEFTAVSHTLVLFCGVISLSDSFEDACGRFTDTELASILRATAPDVTLTTEEWMVLLNQASALTLADDFKNAVLQAGEEDKVGEGLNLFFDFAHSAVSGIGEGTVADLKNATGDGRVGVLYRSLSDDALDLLARIGEIRFRGAEYSLMLELHPELGEALGTTTKTPDDLKTCGDGMYQETLRGILRGIFYD